MSFRILLIEDAANKLAALTDLIADAVPGVALDIRKSVRTGIRALRDRDFDLVLLDMSLPTFEISAEESGGQDRQFGGREVLRQLDRFHIDVPVYVVTQFDEFDAEEGIITLADLDDELRSEHVRTYRGAIFYRSGLQEWQQRIIQVIKEHVIAKGLG